MPHRIREADALGAGADRGLEELGQGVGMGAGRVLGHVHDREAVLRRVTHRFLGVLHEPLERPVLDVLADGARADEGAGLDRNPDFIGDVEDRLDVANEGARGAVGADLELGAHDLAGERRHRLDVPAPGAREAEIRGVDPPADP